MKELPYNLRMRIRDNTATAESEVKIIEAVEEYDKSIKQSQPSTPQAGEDELLEALEVLVNDKPVLNKDNFITLAAYDRWMSALEKSQSRPSKKTVHHSQGSYTTSRDFSKGQANCFCKGNIHVDNQLQRADGLCYYSR